MKINAHKIALSAASAVGISFILYTVAMIVAPRQLMNLMMSGHYISPSAIPIRLEVTWVNAVKGLVAHFIFVYALVWLAATIFNMCERD